MGGEGGGAGAEREEGETKGARLGAGVRQEGEGGREREGGREGGREEGSGGGALIVTCG